MTFNHEIIKIAVRIVVETGTAATVGSGFFYQMAL